MPSALKMREQATRCREIAKDYRADVAVPLYEEAADLEREAARIERQGMERRAAYLAV